MPTKEQEYTHISPQKIDVLPMLKDFASGVLKGNTSDILGSPVDILNLPFELMSKNSTSLETPVAGSKWFRELGGMNPEDASAIETAGTMVSGTGALKKAMILPFALLGKVHGRTKTAQETAERAIEAFSRNDVPLSTIQEMTRGYVDKDAKGNPLVKGVLSDAGASINEDVLNSITNQDMKAFNEAVAMGDKNSWRHLEANVKNKGDDKILSTTAGELLNHPELYEAIPELKNIKVSNLPTFSPYQGTYVTKGGKTVEIEVQTLKDSKAIKETLLHELQHAIQTMEGWKPGGISSDFTRPKVETALRKQLDSVKGTPAEDKIRILQNNLQQLYYDQYQKIPGEQEARFTQNFSNKSQKEIEKTLMKLLQKNKTPSNRMD